MSAPAGQQTESMRLRALLREFEPLRESGWRLCVLPEAGFDLEAAGWNAADCEEAQVVLCWHPDSPCPGLGELEQRATQMEAACLVSEAKPAAGRRLQAISRAARVKEYMTLNAWIADRLRSLCLPAGLLRSLSALAEKLSLKRVVGSRLVGVSMAKCQARLFASEETAQLLQQSRGAFPFARDMIMSFAGIGHLPVVGALLASFVYALIAFAVSRLFGWPALQVLLYATLLLAVPAGVLLEGWAEKRYLAKDAREIVLDEVAGMALTLCFLPKDASALLFLAAFLFFRFFDVLKPGVHWLEKKDWKGSVMWDDLLAGVFAGLLTRLLAVWL